MVESRSQKHTRTRSHGAHEAHELGGFQVRGRRNKKHTRKHDHHMPPEEVRLCCSALDVDVDVSRQGTSHIPASASAYLPCPFLFRTLLLRGTAIGLRLAPLSLCLSVYQACVHSRAVCLPSQLCVQCCPAARARTPVWHLPAELGVVAGSARRPAGWQA